ncbi:NADH-quinone oxidoreductase subunit NuoF [Candidatus Kuenenia sp.]|uniref:NADH-quinone oxidoreductase subunit NuoF n=1 Tax=Candidatus Kuenenia sp. TaxID=2499824 RepID=UPI00321FD850
MEKNNQHIRFVIGLGSCGIAAGAKDLYGELASKIENNPDVSLSHTSCNGMCFKEPILEVFYPDGNHLMMGNVHKKDLDKILDPLLNQGAIDEKFIIEDSSKPDRREDFRQKQHKIVLENCGIIDPDNIDPYIEKGGYEAVKKVLGTMSPQQVIDEIKTSGLRGRGGAGFPTGLKWQFARNSTGEKKYMICNADEGDPGAFMDRAVLEGDPHKVIEGLIIGGYAIGAEYGYVYVRAEYPLAIKRLKLAISQATEKNLLGHNILDSEFSFHLKIKEGAGAFVCGEETALIASIEGERGHPRLKPPFPAVSGLWEYPTNINNVETLASVPWIINNGAKTYASYGTEKSKGTKVFSLAGKIARGGLIEVDMGIPLRDIIYTIGGGTSSGKPFKAVQLGGPSGGCVPERLLDTPVDYESISATGAIMGSGGMVVMDDDTCIVDVAKFFLTFTQNESCGKCTFCRIGTKRLLEILEKITEGRGGMADLEELEDLSEKVKDLSLCGLGKTAPNPIMTTLKYFKDEYVEHIKENKCRAGVCKELIKFSVIDGSCTGCHLCYKNCPVDAITGETKKVHHIDQKICIKCGMCYEVCKFDAILKG